MNRTEPLRSSGVLSGVCACIGFVKGTVLCADPWGQPYVCVLVCLLGICTQLPCHWLDLETRCCGSLAPLGTGVTLGQEGSPWGPKPLHSGTLNSAQLQSQPAAEQFHAQGSCTGQTHTAGCCFSWIALLLPYLTAPGSCLRRDSESWHLPPLYVSLMKVHASSALRKLSKCGGITTKQSPLRVTTCFLQKTAITVLPMIQMDTASSCKTPSLWKMCWVTLKLFLELFKMTVGKYVILPHS